MSQRDKGKGKVKTIGYDVGEEPFKLTMENLPGPLIRAWGAYCALRGITMKSDLVEWLQEKLKKKD